MVLALLTDACSFLDDSARAEQLYALLLPYGDRCLVMGGGLLAWGSAARHVALAAATARRWDEAEAWFEAGIDQNARMRMAPWQALTEHDYARMRVARGGPGDETAARRLGTRALATAERLGMAGLATKARRLLAQVGG